MDTRWYLNHLSFYAVTLEQNADNNAAVNLMVIQERQSLGIPRILRLTSQRDNGTKRDCIGFTNTNTT